LKERGEIEIIQTPQRFIFFILTDKMNCLMEEAL
jgi:hypothetical protein